MTLYAEKQPTTAYFAFGSNLSTAIFPNPLQTIQHSIRALERDGVQLIATGSFYETEPVPKSDQPWYVNTVAAYLTSWNAQKLLDWALELELKIGRERSIPNAARVIDIDLIDFGGQILEPNKQESNPLVLPHPRAHLRAFVLYPLRDLVPDWQHPVTGHGIDSLIEDISSEQVLGEHFKKLTE